MRTLRVLLSLLFLAVVLSFGYARLAKADDAAKCNCTIESTGKYGVNNPQGVCVVDNNCFILIN